MTAAVPSLPPPEARTMNGPPAVFPATKTPAAETVPPPVTVHTSVGCEASTAPNWSDAEARERLHA